MSWAASGQGYPNEKTNRQVIAMFQSRGFALNEKLTIKYRQLSDNNLLRNRLLHNLLIF